MQHRLQKIAFAFGLMLMVGGCSKSRDAELAQARDDKLLKKSKKLKTRGTQVVSPLQLIAEVAP